MAGNTPYFKMAFFDFGDSLDTSINVGREVDRFMFIDKQIYGLYQVFGDGVIAGWDIFDNGFSQETGISIGITGGTGVVNSVSTQTTFPSFLYGLLPSTTLDIYVVSTGVTITDRTVNFIVVSSGTTPGGSILKLATIVTSANGVTSIDNSVRDYISFQQLIIDEVNSHKHRGTPTKIDLTKDVKNQLPNARIDSIEASKIATGRIPETSVPVLNHNDLLNKGLVTHAGLDSYIQTINTPSIGLLGELTTVNMLKQMVFLRYQYNDVDTYLINEIAILPGVTPSSLIDFEESTANIDLISGCIVGFPFADSDAYFYTTNFRLPEDVSRGIITTQSTLPNDAELYIGINTKNSVDFDDYQIVNENRVFQVNQPDRNLRIALKLVSGFGQHDPYLISFQDFVDFVFVNESSSDLYFHFRNRFYNDPLLTDLHTTIYSGVSQEGWVVNDLDPIPPGGYYVKSGEMISVTNYADASLFVTGKTYYLIIDAFDGTTFTSAASGYTFVASGSSVCDQYANLPVVKNFAVLFEMEDNATVMLNL